MQVTIEKCIIEWVLEQLETEMISQDIINMLEQWKNNSKQPTFNQVEKISKTTGIPFGYFFLKKPPTEDTSMLEHRTIDSVVYDALSRNLMETLHDMRNIQDWMHSLLAEQHSEMLDFVGSMQNETSIMRFAGYVRTLLDIDDLWFLKCANSYESFKYLRKRISETGILVMMNGVVGNNTHRPLSIEEFRAFVLIDEYAPLIFINSNDSYNGKAFSLIHELAHVLIGDNSLYNDIHKTYGEVSKAEIICNAVAAEILVPQKSFNNMWLQTPGTINEKIYTISKHHRCGSVVVARRALDYKYINRQQYNAIVDAAIKEYSRQRKNEGSPGGNYYRAKASKIDNRFFNYLSQSVREGKTLYSDAFRLTKTNRKTFENLLAQMGGGL